MSERGDSLHAVTDGAARDPSSMKAIITPAPQAALAVTLKDGRVLTAADVLEIVITPAHLSASGRGELLHGECTTADGRKVDEFRLIIDARSKVVRRGPQNAAPSSESSPDTFPTPCVDGPCFGLH